VPAAAHGRLVREPGSMYTAFSAAGDTHSRAQTCRRHHSMYCCWQPALATGWPVAAAAAALSAAQGRSQSCCSTSPGCQGFHLNTHRLQKGTWYDWISCSWAVIQPHPLKQLGGQQQAHNVIYVQHVPGPQSLLWWQARNCGSLWVHTEEHTRQASTACDDCCC
jgi:hypothetical protein